MKKKNFIFISICLIVITLLSFFLFIHKNSSKNTYPIAKIPSNYKINKATQGEAIEANYSKLFNTENIETVKINISKKNLNYLLDNALDTPTVLANSISIGNNKINYVGIRTKGNSTLRNVHDDNSNRFSFSINFGKYIKKSEYGEKQNFYGLHKISLNNMYGDATLLKEYLSYKLMTDMNIPTPYYALVNLYINDENYGLYLLLENIDEALINRTLKEEGGLLCKPELPGSDLLCTKDYNSFDISSTDYKDNDIYKDYSGIWDNVNEGIDINNYKKSKKIKLNNQINSTIEWIKNLNLLSSSESCNTAEYKSSLEKLIDVDEVIRYFAVNTYLVNLDSYQSGKAHNYALYLNNVARIIPWDYNYSFGNYGTTEATDMVNFDIYNPLIDVDISKRPLLNVILKNSDYRALYEKYLEDCVIITTKGGQTSDNKSYAPNNYINTISNMKSKLLDKYTNNSCFYKKKDFLIATDGLTQLITARSLSVDKQLNGDTTPVDIDVDMTDLGKSTASTYADFNLSNPFNKNY
ncbi:CotH kinase family protein [Clostridium sp. MSJ-8]|uniref:CotH kinase family protein n=1 Tax=Clostridium sp. MSJ-8 TaxID=2841510 RepID=UPI001C0F0933|nr:CotH kinase family protein [Clostridium sp. MSJ-8]MBU5487145.1 CotH kinase family protein [Clostridium sp. MSJ-8]